MTFPLRQNAERITPSDVEENVKLFNEIMAGKKAMERLIEGNMAYVVSKVAFFLADFPTFKYLQEDLISEGFLVLTRIAKKLGTVAAKDFNPQGMISRSLRNAFLNVIRSERSMNVPLTEEIESTLTYEAMSAVDLKLDILGCCKDGLEEQIVRLRCEGLEDEAIAIQLGASKATICRTRQAIYQRYREQQSD